MCRTPDALDVRGFKEEPNSNNRDGQGMRLSVLAAHLLMGHSMDMLLLLYEQIHEVECGVSSREIHNFVARLALLMQTASGVQCEWFACPLIRSCRYKDKMTQLGIRHGSQLPSMAFNTKVALLDDKDLMCFHHIHSPVGRCRMTSCMYIHLHSLSHQCT